MKASKPYHDDLMKDLKKPKEALAYLNACLEGGNPDVFLLGLRDVAEAQGGMTRLSKGSRIGRENLYRILGKKGNPELHTLGNLLHGLGFRMALVENRPSHFQQAA
ncbi:MAG: putative addiction module antidote protein [Elusimicrobia bacterium]|nr:putative addiction module antidote protein [Elusimicrobiota bacterium]